MKLLPLLLATALLPAQTPVRRAIAPNPQNGWARVVVDDDGVDGIWIGDAEGRSVPFLWESDAHWSSIPLSVAHPVWGRDVMGQATGAFTLQAPSGFARGDREQVKLDFDLQAAAAPWACRVEVSRRGDGGAFVAMDDAPRFVYDLGPDRRATSITVPWDADDWRVTLVPVQGGAPKLTGVRASACTLPSELKADAGVGIEWESITHRDGQVILEHALHGRHELAGFHMVLQPPAAPIHIVVSSIQQAPDGEGESSFSLGDGELWNLPALGTANFHLELHGRTDRVRVQLPEGASVGATLLFIRHRRLFFPAEAGKAYFLHEGGLAKVAPGSLGELPASSRAFYAGAPLPLGAPEADGQALVAAPDPAAKLRRWLPWGVGFLLLLLGLWGFRLLKSPQD